MSKEIIELLKEFDTLVDDINDCKMKIRINNEPFIEATTADRLEFLREEWFKVVEELYNLGCDIREEG